MAGDLQPLQQYQQITKPDGTPTDFFIRWAQERQIDITDAITLQVLEQYLADHPLQAGSGITLTPSGNLADSPTIAAEVQAILDQLSTTHGAIIYRDSADWAVLAPGTSGQVLQTNGAAVDPSWVTPSAGGGAWSLISTTTIGAAVAQVDFTGLGGYSDLLVIVSAVPASVSGVRRILASTNNGATFYSASGDYQAIVSDGTVVNNSEWAAHATNSTAARTLSASMFGINVLNAPKICAFSGSASQRQFVADNANNVDAIRVNNSAGGNLTGGTIYLFGR